MCLSFFMYSLEIRVPTWWSCWAIRCVHCETLSISGLKNNCFSIVKLWFDSLIGMLLASASRDNGECCPVEAKGKTNILMNTSCLLFSPPCLQLAHSLQYKPCSCFHACDSPVQTRYAQTHSSSLACQGLARDSVNMSFDHRVFCIALGGWGMRIFLWLVLRR